MLGFIQAPHSDIRHSNMNDKTKLAEAIRAACLEAALRAYEDAGISGLCEDGRWECAVQAIQGLDVTALIKKKNTKTDSQK
jgi:hypothetical protein